MSRSALTYLALIGFLTTANVEAQAPSLATLQQELQETQRLLISLQSKLAAQEAQIQALQGAKEVKASEVVQVPSGDRPLAKKGFLDQIQIGAAIEGVAGYRSESRARTGGDRPGGADVFIRSAEITAQGSIDPFTKGYLVMNATDGGDGEADLGIEEAALVTTALPYNLGARVGRFFGDFGRLASRHQHELPFVERPLVLEDYVGGESKTDGVEFSYLLPIEHYVNLSLGVGNQFGEEQSQAGDFRNFSELTYFGRLGSYVDLSESLNAEFGLSGIFTPDSDGRGDLPETRRVVGGLDLTLRYQPLDATRYQGIEWGSELLLNDSRYGEFVEEGDVSRIAGSGESLESIGLYSYLAAKLEKEWTAGFLFDYVESSATRGEETYRYSPYLTWNVSEFQLWRLQYSFTDRSSESGQADEDAVLLQWAYVLGPHSHGFRQR
jgi:hypothetical protein